MLSQTLFTLIGLRVSPSDLCDLIEYYRRAPINDAVKSLGAARHCAVGSPTADAVVTVLRHLEAEAAREWCDNSTAKLTGDLEGDAANKRKQVSLNQKLKS